MSYGPAEDFITVAMLNTYISGLLERDAHLRDVWVKGEISGFRLYQQSGHIYFTLKDKEAAVSCVMFRSRNQGLRFRPEDGMEVLVRGNVAVYALQGKYQVYVEEMQPYGVGGIFLYLEQLKAKLAAQGYFDQERKKPIPAMVSRLGVVTSQDGAAIRDILRVVKQRHAGVDVILAHSAVQGTEAPRELAQGVELLNVYAQVDVIIIARGGGSLEDLMAFNSEEVVEAVFNSRIPVISGVGHEVDVSLCDLAADLRAATPTQAAQLAVPEYSLLQKQVGSLGVRMRRAMLRCLANREERLDRSMMKRVWREPALLLQKQAETVRDRGRRLHQAMLAVLKDKNHKLALAAAGLDKLSPLQVLARGFAILTQNDTIIRSVDQVSLDDEVKAELADGSLRVLIKSKEKVERWRK